MATKYSINIYNDGEWNGVLDGKVLGCDGNFGPNSDYALRIFQKEHGLTMDGICGAETRKKLRE